MSDNRTGCLEIIVILVLMLIAVFLMGLLVLPTIEVFTEVP